MKILQVVPKPGDETSLKQLLKSTERQLRGTTTTFVRKSEGRWAHKKYPGRIHWDETFGGVLVAEVQTKEQSAEWQLLRAFIGYLDRHLGERIESITIVYR